MRGAFRAAKQLDSAAARLLPITTMVLAAIASVLPVPIPGYSAIAPALTLMAAYHWTIYRPNLLPPASLFLIGLGQDLVSGAPLGVTALLLLMTRALVLGMRQHFANRSFPFVWAGFVLLSAAAMLFLWALNSALDMRALEFRSTVFRAVLTISLFPIGSFLLGRSQRALMGLG